MRKNFKFALMSAAALLSLGLASCSSNDEAEVNPTFDGQNVKTQFSISLPASVAKTRMAGSTVQVAEDIATFRGMQDIVIIPFANATNRTARLGSNIVLGANTMVKPTTTNNAQAIPSGQLLATNNAVLYNDVTVPVGTTGFLFYGKAAGTDGYAEGYLTTEGLTGEPAEIFFNPTPIQATLTTTVGNALASYVTSIAAATNWAGCADAANSAETWYNAGLGEMYTSFITLKAGASAYVQAAVQDLFKSIRNNTDDVSKAIKTAILAKATDDGSGNLTFDPTLNGYPADNNSMPDGCATLAWSSATPAVASVVTNNGFAGSTYAQDMAKVVYPASLYYFVDSDLKTSNTSRADDYTATDDWTTILAKYTNGTSVAAATRSVAINKPIQYAVGRLDVTVAAMSQSHYYDRKGEEVTVPAAGYTLTGVLIGGQKKVDYKFEPVTSATEYAIYDNTINTQSASAVLSATAAAGPNYTLALETEKDIPVYVVLEFLNTGEDFQGFDGVCKAGCKFYMIAQLDPKDTNTNAANQASTGNKVFKQDFKTIANFTIGAGTTDTNNDGVADTPAGLANAYVTIPDLRTPQLELGFSVDLKWQKGITFTHTF